MEMTTNNVSLWEEKNSIGQKMNCLNNNGVEQKNTIINTEKELEKKECVNIGNEKKWMRNCPKCGIILFYSSKQHLKTSIGKNKMCRKCRFLNENKYIGKKYGSLTITKQYNGFSPCGSCIIKVDYKCDCGYDGFNKRIESIKRQKICLICRKQNKHKIIDMGKSAFNNLYHGYKKSAEKRLYSFELTKTEFESLIKQNCFYCGNSPTNVQKALNGREIYIYNGIDRQDNKIGYNMKNCVTCCKLCNCFKMQLSVDDFLNHVEKIYKRNFAENKRR